MGRQTEAYRKMHPEQFSDSKIVKKGQLNRDYMDFFLETLTSKSLDKQFEEFCRHIAENEICPNLLPQTGPTGGGDSKVDSETYPVSEMVSEQWYYGYGDKAATQRWAFAISAKKEWKSKVKSDVAKIVKIDSEKERGYVKIFFMSNQYISDKKRAETEDELRSTYHIDVRILDRTWLLDKIFSNDKNIEATIKSFGLSEFFLDEVQIGERDFKRKKEYNDLENSFTQDKIKPSEKVALAHRAVILARELEFDKNRILGIIDRSIRISREYGNKVDLADSYYDAAWTMYWWYSDGNRFYEFYQNFEELALKEDNVNLFCNLITLWLNLFSESLQNSEIPISEHTLKIQERYQWYINNPSRPNTSLEAKTAYQLMRILLHDDINDVVNEMLQILEDSFGHLDLNLYPMQRIIQEIPIFENAEKFDELFEKMVSVMSNQERKTEAARMLAKRGHALKEKKPYEALSYFSRTLISFFNEKDKHFLITVVMEMGEIFEKVGLLWAARNFYYFDFCLCLNQYMKFGDVSPWFFLSANSLKYIELRLGHVLYASELHFLEQIARQCYPGKLEESDEMDDNFDYVLAIQILRSEFQIEKELGQLSSYLENRGLIFSAAAAKYELGYYDEDILASLDGNIEAFDDMIGKWKEQPVLEQLKYLPWYGVENKCKMQTSVLGCCIEVEILGGYEHGGVEVGATVLATIESFFGTGVSNGLISVTGKIEAEISYDRDCEAVIQGKIDVEKPNRIIISFSDYNSENIIESQKQFADFMLEVIGMIISIMFPYGVELKKIEQMIKNDAAFERSNIFANSVFYGMETLGKDYFTFETVLNGYECLPMKRVEKRNLSNKENNTSKKTESVEGKLHYEEPPCKDEFRNVSNEDIITSSIINVSLWDISEWKGVLYLADPYHHSIQPIFSFLYENKVSENIFVDWIKEIGKYDEDNQIGIRVIKGIDKKHPYWYRVVVGTLKFRGKGTSKPQIIASPTRVITMTPNNNNNLQMFENELNRETVFQICPAVINTPYEQPHIYNNLAIRKNKSSILICDAHEVPEDDFLCYSGVLPEDDPIIPFDKKDVPIMKMIEHKKSIIERKKSKDY